jgi:hypothetical protein
MEIGIDSFAAILPDPATGALPSAIDRMAELLEGTPSINTSMGTSWTSISINGVSKPAK